MTHFVSLLRVRAGNFIHRVRQRLAIALLAQNGWEALRCASCPGASCLLFVDEPGKPTRCPYESDNDHGVAFGEGY